MIKRRTIIRSLLDCVLAIHRSEAGEMDAEKFMQRVVMVGRTSDGDFEEVAVDTLRRLVTPPALGEDVIMSYRLDRYNRQAGPIALDTDDFELAANMTPLPENTEGWLHGWLWIAHSGQARFNLNDVWLSSRNSTSSSYTRRFFVPWAYYNGTWIHMLPKKIPFTRGIRMTWDSGNTHLYVFYELA